MKKLINLSIIFTFVLMLTSMPSVVMADSSGDNVTQIINNLRNGNVSKAQTYNQMLPETATAESCVSNMPRAMKAAYRNEVKSWENVKQYGNYAFRDYWLTDIDNDGSAELLINLVPDTAGAMTHVYKYQGGQLLEIGEFSGNVTCHAYPSHNGIVTEGGKMGYNWLSLITIENGELAEDQLISYGNGNLSWDQYFHMRNRLKTHAKWNGEKYAPIYDDLGGGMPTLQRLNLKFNNSTNISFDWGSDLFKGNAAATNSYNLNLAKAAIYLCEGTYNGQSETETRMSNLGLSVPSSEYYAIDSQTNTSPITAASDVVTLGNEQYLFIAVAVRGTQDDGWDYVTDIRSGLFNVDGFAEAGETGMNFVRDYFDDMSSQTGIGKDHTILFVTGHSLGAAIAGQIAGNLQNEVALQNHIFAYTFASPYYETHGRSVSSYTNIHNLINTEDAVPKFPLGGVRYGVDHTFKGDGKDILDQHMVTTYLRALLKSESNSSSVKVPATSITKLTKGKKAFVVKWKKKSGVSGYQIQYAIKSNFKGAKTKTVKKASTVSAKIKKLKSKKKYYVRVRAYKTIKGKKYYSAWSKKKSVKTR